MVEERRLGGSCGESFLNEASEQYRPVCGSCSLVQMTKKPKKRGGKKTELFLHHREEKKCVLSNCVIVVIVVLWFRTKKTYMLYSVECVWRTYRHVRGRNEGV